MIKISFEKNSETVRRNYVHLAVLHDIKKLL